MDEAEKALRLAWTLMHRCPEYQCWNEEYADKNIVPPEIQDAWTQMSLDLTHLVRLLEVYPLK